MTSSRMVAACKDFYRYIEFVIGHLGLYGRYPFNKKFPAEVRKFRGDEWIATATGVVSFLTLKKKMADVVLLVSELEDYFDFINVVVEDDDRLNAC